MPIQDGAFEVFCDELDALVDKWRSKPLDDQITIGNVVSAMEAVKWKLHMEAFGQNDEDEE